MCEPIEDLPEKQFIYVMALQFAKYTGQSVSNWINYAKQVYDDFCETCIPQLETGDDYDWCRQAAIEVADAEMEYWE